MLTLTRLKELLYYDQETGMFIWKINRGRKTKKGQVAGCLTIKGHWQITVDGRTYQAARLVWLYYYGKLPDKMIDHKNRIGTDNRISNLREATTSQNNINSVVLSKSNRTGFKGVGVTTKKNKHKKPFIARIKVDGRDIFLGYFSDPEVAAAAYKDARSKYFGEFAPLEDTERYLSEGY